MKNIGQSISHDVGKILMGGKFNLKQSIRKPLQNNE